MADERTWGFNKDDAQSLLQGIGVGESSFPEIKPRGGGSSHRRAVIASALTAPVSTLEVATTCDIYFLQLQADGTTIVLTDVYPETAYNDDPDVTAEVGTYCRVERIDGRWMIYYLGCYVQSDLEYELP